MKFEANFSSPKNKVIQKIFLLSAFLILLLTFFSQKVLAGPQSTSYEIKSYNFGSGGTQDNNSANYTLFGTSGETSNNGIDSTNYTFNGGLTYTFTTNVPAAPTFSNPSNYYNKLQLIVNTSSNPADTKYALAVSTDNFVSNIKYVQADNTLGTNPVWQTYLSWGGASGIYVLGLTTGTTYYAKVSAMQGTYTQSPFSSVSSTSTSNSTLSFDIDVATTDTETAAPYTLDIGQLSVGSVTTAAKKIWIDVDTNAQGGAYVYTSADNNGLRSASLSYTIPSSSTDLSTAQQGFGIQSSSTTQSSGGPLTPLSPYNGASENVGILDTTIRELFSTSGNPITGGRASLLIKAKASSTTPASTDYSDTVTLITSGTF